MPIKTADNADILQIIEQIYDLWSSGLNQDDYRYFFKQALGQSWSRRNTARYVYKVSNKIKSSCKTVQLLLSKKREIYNILGLGALFTHPGWRQSGLASEMIEFVLALARKQNLAGVLLFSDLNPDFYSNFGFNALGNLDFEIDLQSYKCTKEAGLDEHWQVSLEIHLIVPWQRPASNVRLGTSRNLYTSAGLEEDELWQILRCYNRWASRQPFAIIRELEYFSYQFSKFLYFSKNKKTTWRLTLCKNGARQVTGYAITECSGTKMRILEIIGDNKSLAYLWQSLIEQAATNNLTTINGFEAIVRDFIPKNSLDLSEMDCRTVLKASQIQCFKRNWGQPMFLAIDEDLDDLIASNPCPLLELDYF